MSFPFSNLSRIFGGGGWYFLCYPKWWYQFTLLPYKVVPVYTPCFTSSPVLGHILNYCQSDECGNGVVMERVRQLNCPNCPEIYAFPSDLPSTCFKFTNMCGSVSDSISCFIGLFVYPYAITTLSIMAS